MQGVFIEFKKIPVEARKVMYRAFLKEGFKKVNVKEKTDNILKSILSGYSGFFISFGENDSLDGGFIANHIKGLDYVGCDWSSVTFPPSLEKGTELTLKSGEIVNIPCEIIPGKIHEIVKDVWDKIEDFSYVSDEDYEITFIQDEIINPELDKEKMIIKAVRTQINFLIERIGEKLKEIDSIPDTEDFKEYKESIVSEMNKVVANLKNYYNLMKELHPSDLILENRSLNIILGNEVFKFWNSEEKEILDIHEAF